MEETPTCPVCLDDLDITDQAFEPCINKNCDYQVCLWCWYKIRETMDGKCPACRVAYSDQAIENSKHNLSTFKSATSSSSSSKNKNDKTSSFKYKEIKKESIIFT